MLQLCHACPDRINISAAMTSFVGGLQGDKTEDCKPVSIVTFKFSL